MNRPEKSKKETLAFFIRAPVDVLTLSNPKQSGPTTIKYSRNDHDRSTQGFIHYYFFQLRVVFVFAFAIVFILISPGW
jgi:hypothetical protein